MFSPMFGMSFNPFGKEASANARAFASNDFTEMSKRLKYLSEVRGVGVFTSPPGGGKTYALRCFAKGLNPNLHQMAYFCLSTISVTEFYQQLCRAVGAEPRQSKAAMFCDVQERLHNMFKEKRRPLILALDEAHDLEPRILRDIKMVMNHGYDSLNCFTLILVGEPHLNSILEKPVHEALRQRIAVHYNFVGMSAKEAVEYVASKLESAGAASSVVDEAALSAVHGYAQGNPRLIDNVMSDALVIAAQAGKASVDSESAYSAINNQALA